MTFSRVLALATGAAMPIMMWLFQSVINGLVSIGSGSSQPPPNWYNHEHLCFFNSFDLILVIRILNQLVIHIVQLKGLSNGMQYWVQRVLLPIGWHMLVG